MTEYTSPVKVPDGRYIVKTASPKLVTLYNVVITKQGDDCYCIQVPGNDKTLDDIDKEIVNDAVTHSTEWFRKEMSHDIVSSYFQSSVDDGVLQVDEVVNARGKSQVLFFGQSKEVIEFVSGSTYNVLLQLDGLWFLKRSFGTTWKIVQARMKKDVQPVECLIRDEDSD